MTHQAGERAVKAIARRLAELSKRLDKLKIREDYHWNRVVAFERTLREMGVGELLAVGQEMRDWRPAAEDAVRYDAALDKVLKAGG